LRCEQRKNKIQKPHLVVLLQFVLGDFDVVSPQKERRASPNLFGDGMGMMPIAVIIITKHYYDWPYTELNFVPTNKFQMSLQQATVK
jgi:hypothetical protein